LFQESDYFTPQGEFRVDAAGSPTLLNCLMYKLSYFRFGELQVSFSPIPTARMHQCVQKVLMET